jgi:ATP-dependent DNA helicase RecQ
VRGLVHEVLGQGDDFSVSLHDLAAAHDIRPTVVSTLLTYLELEGYLEAGTPYYARYQFKALWPSAEILARFEGERRDFLAGVFRQAEKARVWLTLDVEKAARATGSPRERVVRALDYLHEQGMLEVKVEGVRNRFRRLRTPADPEALSQALFRRTQEREEREIGRLRQVLELAGHDGCQVSRLGEHFGEPLAGPCGHCSWCLNGHQPSHIPARPVCGIDPEVRRQVGALRQEQPEVFAEPRTLARFLCGLTSPRLTRERLSGHALFGKLEQVPFPEVLAWASA